MHCWHAFERVLVHKLQPSEHLRHDELPPLEKNPERHKLQVLLLKPYVELQAEQIELLVQAVQPVIQFIQLEFPPREYVPFKHAMHVLFNVS